MNPQENRVLSSPFAPVLWIAVSTPLIFLSVLGAGYSNIQVSNSVVLASITIICLPSVGVSLVQYFLLRPVRPSFWRWIIISAVGTAMGLVMGWVAVLGGAALINKSGADLMLQSDKLTAAAISGGVCGMIGGGVTGIFASLGQWVALRLDRQMTRAWMGANMTSWGVGLAAIGALVFGIVSQITFTF